MSIQPHQGILNIPNATLRVGKLAVDSTAGFDTVFNSVSKNTILLEDVTEYTVTKQWDLKMPNIFVATFKIKGAGSSFNFQNTSVGTAVNGYTLLFSGTTLTLKYDDGDLATATISNLDSVYGKVYVTFEKQYFTVTIDGTRVLTYKDTGTRTPPEGEFVNFFAGTGGAFEELKVVAGNWISDGTSNVALMGGNLDVHGEVGVTSNLEVGTANLFVDTVNSRVGLGTSTPGATLDVSGNVYVSSNLEVGTANLFVDTVNSRVGLGTTTPLRTLDIVGDIGVTANTSIFVGSNVVAEYTGPHDRPLREYPEINMTAATTAGYTASASIENNTTTHAAFNAFTSEGFNRWQNGGSRYDTNSPFLHTAGETTNDTDGTPHVGDWIQLQLPNKINLSRIRFSQHSSAPSYQPKSYVILGSNDNTSWKLIHTQANLAPASGNTNYKAEDSFTTIGHFKYIRLVVKSLQTTVNQIIILRLQYYGHEEGDSSLDTTLKSVYNVPGTQLEVYYDGQDYTSLPTTVTDKAGTATNATISNSGSTITFDSTYKAWTFGGSSGRTDTFRSSTLPSTFTGNQVHSITLWFNMSNISDGSIFVITPSTGENGGDVIMGQTQGNGARISYSFWGNDVSFDLPTILTTETWYHLSMTYDAKDNSTGRKMFLNGIECTAINTASGSLSLPNSNMIISFANRVSQTSYPFFGSIANFRLFSKALNAGQVKELYDYQKDYFLGSKSQVTLYKGHLGVGVTEPSGQLELAGDERIQEYPPRAMTGWGRDGTNRHSEEYNIHRGSW